MNKSFLVWYQNVGYLCVKKTAIAKGVPKRWEELKIVVLAMRMYYVGKVHAAALFVHTQRPTPLLSFSDNLTL